jgi:hypothetical protein
VEGNTLEPLLLWPVAALVLIALVLVLAWLSRRLAGLPYRRVDPFLSEAERSFFGVLRRVAGNNRVVFVKVRMFDLLTVPGDAARRQSHVNRIMSKHVDFVVCDAARLIPLVAIELDDRSHDSAARLRRDALVDRAFAAAGLPLVHVRAKRSYVTADIEALLRGYTGEPQSAV